MATILIVDDELANRELLHIYLGEAGHQWVDAESGESALDLVKQGRPDLVLLDVMLPGLSGFETAERLKVETRGEFLPVILVTALNDRAARLQGLRAGADDFLSKPVDHGELSLRIGNLLALRAKETALIRRNVELAELQRFRDEVSAMMVHDLKNPLSVVISNADFLIDGGFTSHPDALDALHDSRAAGTRALRLLANLLDVTKIESGNLQPQRSKTSVAGLVEPIMHLRMHLAQSRGISLSSSIAPEAQLEADPELMGRLIENVLDNAFRYTPGDGKIVVQATTLGKTVQIRIGNTGEPIPPEVRGRIFEKFSHTTPEAGRMNLGLGLYFCRLAAEAHGGRIWVEETEEFPTVFTISLPV